MKHRLTDSLEDDVWKTQYGFRKGRSTAHALFVARRILDLAAAGTDHLFMVFLDWETAFDKVDHEMLMTALIRLGVPKKMINVLKGFCVNPKVLC